jgi:Mor family transcriptional regulator
MSRILITNLTGGFKELAETIGLDAAEKLARRMGGQAVYIPKADSIEIMLRNEQIAKEFTGSNYRELAQKYDLSERHVRHILDNMRPQATRELIPTRTLSIEDFLPREED